MWRLSSSGSSGLNPSQSLLLPQSRRRPRIVPNRMPDRRQTRRQGRRLHHGLPAKPPAQSVLRFRGRDSSLQTRGRGRFRPRRDPWGRPPDSVLHRAMARQLRPSGPGDMMGIVTGSAATQPLHRPAKAPVRDNRARVHANPGRPRARAQDTAAKVHARRLRARWLAHRSKDRLLVPAPDKQAIVPREGRDLKLDQGRRARLQGRVPVLRCRSRVPVRPGLRGVPRMALQGRRMEDSVPTDRLVPGPDARVVPAVRRRQAAMPGGEVRAVIIAQLMVEDPGTVPAPRACSAGPKGAHAGPRWFNRQWVSWWLAN